jgi:hypothetical protein
MIYYDIEVNSEIIQTMSYDNYDDFQHVNFVFSQKKNHYFKDCLMTKLLLG